MVTGESKGASKDDGTAAAKDKPTVSKDERKAERQRRKEERKKKKGDKKKKRAEKKKSKGDKSDSDDEPAPSSAPLVQLLARCEDDELAPFLEQHFADSDTVSLDRLRMARELARAAFATASSTDEAAGSEQVLLAIHGQLLGSHQE